MRLRNVAWFLAGLVVCLGLARVALGDRAANGHKLTWKHFDGTNAADALLKFDSTKLGKGQPAIDALYKLIAALPAGDQINVKQGVEVRPGMRQFPLSLGDLIKVARKYGVVVNVPAINAPA